MNSYPHESSSPVRRRARWSGAAMRILALVLLATVATGSRAAVAFELHSPAFAAQTEIPVLHTCKGTDQPPPLMWSDASDATKSFALIVDDPDAPDPAAPVQTWVHWVIYNIPSTSSGLDAAQPLPSGTLAGLNDWKAIGYRGPCPPIGRHRYFFKLYALDRELPDLGKPTKAALEKAMQGHVLGEAQLWGTFSAK